LALRKAYFLVSQIANNTAVSVASSYSSNVSFVEVVSCAMNGKYTLEPVKAQVFSVSTYPPDSDRRLLSESTPETLFSYQVNFFYPSSNKQDDLEFYYGNLTTQLRDIVKNGDFTSIFAYYCQLNSCPMKNANFILEPMIQGPFSVVNPLVPESSSSTNRSLPLMYILIAVGVIAFFLCTVICFITTNRRKSENQLEQWIEANKSVENININFNLRSDTKVNDSHFGTIYGDKDKYFEEMINPTFSHDTGTSDSIVSISNNTSRGSETSYNYNREDLARFSRKLKRLQEAIDVGNKQDYKSDYSDPYTLSDVESAENPYAGDTRLSLSLSPRTPRR
jgi:hypothetical protein